MPIGERPTIREQYANEDANRHNAEGGHLTFNTFGGRQTQYDIGDE